MMRFIAISAVLMILLITLSGCLGPAPTPVEPTQPTLGEPTEPGLPTPSEPTEPTEPTVPVDPTEPVEPTEPTEPVEPTEPTEPIVPTTPKTPGEIVERAKTSERKYGTSWEDCSILYDQFVEQQECIMGVAIALGDDEICSHINPNASGWKPKCFMAVAQKAADPTICDRRFISQNEVDKCKAGISG